MLTGWVVASIPYFHTSDASVCTKIKLDIWRLLASCVGNAFIVQSSSGNHRHINTINGF